MTNWYKNNHVCFQKLFFYATVKNPLLNHSSLVPVPVVWVDERVWNRFKHFENICFCKVRYRVLLSVFLSYWQRVQNNSFRSRLIKSIAFPNIMVVACLVWVILSANMWLMDYPLRCKSSFLQKVQMSLLKDLKKG